MDRSRCKLVVIGFFAAFFCFTLCAPAFSASITTKIDKISCSEVCCIDTQHGSFCIPHSTTGHGDYITSIVESAKVVDLDATFSYFYDKEYNVNFACSMSLNGKTVFRHTYRGDECKEGAVYEKEKPYSELYSMYTNSGYSFSLSECDADFFDNGKMLYTERNIDALSSAKAAGLNIGTFEGVFYATCATKRILSYDEFKSAMNSVVFAEQFFSEDQCSINACGEVEGYFVGDLSIKKGLRATIAPLSKDNNRDAISKELERLMNTGQRACVSYYVDVLAPQNVYVCEISSSGREIYSAGRGSKRPSKEVLDAYVKHAR